jgi:RecA/RadA recombinase
MEQGLADLIIFDSISNLNLEPTLRLGFKDIINPLLQKIQEYNTSLIFLSQIRHDSENGGITTPKNTAISDVANIRIMLDQVSLIKHLDVVIGKRVGVNIYKNTLADTNRTEFELFI